MAEKRKKKPNETRGKAEVAQGRTLAHQSRNSKTLTNKDKLKAGKAAAGRLMKGTIQKNRAARNK